MKIPDGNPVRFDSESCLNVCAAGRVDRRTAMSSGHRLHSSAATSLAFVAACRPIARRAACEIVLESRGTGRATNGHSVERGPINGWKAFAVEAIYLTVIL